MNLDPVPVGGADCARVREILSASFDSAAPTGALAAAERHLAACGDCAAFWTALPRLSRELAALRAGATSDLWPRIEARLRARAAPRRSWLRPTVAVLAGAAAAGTVLLALELRLRRGADPHDALQPFELLALEAGPRALAPRLDRLPELRLASTTLPPKEPR